MNEKSILVLARRDHAEAMRVAAGLTIFGHQVGLVFMTAPVAETEETAANAANTATTAAGISVSKARRLRRRMIL